MRKPVNPVTEPTEPSTAVVLVGTYELETKATDSPFVLFRTHQLPINYRVVDATCFRSDKFLRAQEKLIIRVRQFGEGVSEARFLVVWEKEGRINLPRIKPSPRDPEDSAMLQWSFWQGVRVGGGLYHDVYDVTHLEFEGFDADEPRQT